MRFSLIVGTVGRMEEPARLLESLAAQTVLPYEVVLVDQNEDNRLQGLYESYRDRLPLQWLKTNRRGLSRARNLGLKQVGGEVIAFPDDDCIYPSDLLAQVGAVFQRVETGGVIVAEASSKKIAQGFINRFELWRVGVSYRIFLRRSVTCQVGEFDETLGVGAGTLYGSGEESDYLIRCLKRGERIYYEPELKVLHPEVDYADSEKAYIYACGRREVLQKHGYPACFRWLDATWPLLRALRRLNDPERARYYWKQFCGRSGLGRTSL